MKKLPLFKVHIDKRAALKQIKEVLDSGFINEGVQVTALTKAMKERFGTEHLILANSCTSTLTLALSLTGVRPYDEVISTPMTCVATNCPIINMGANIAWADIDPETGCIDPEDVGRRLKENPKIKAVIVVAWAGNPPELHELRAICDFYGTKLILDAAHAFGATYDGQDISHLPDFSCYSFQAIKHVTTGDGGMLICRNADDWKRAKQLKWFGIDRDAAKDANGDWKGQHWDFDITTAGYKFNMNNISAAIGLSQLPHIDRIIKTHQDNASLYKGLLADSRFVTPLRVPGGSQSSNWVYTILLNERHKHMRDELLFRLNMKGIGAGVVHVPNDSYTCFEKFVVSLPGTQSFFERQLSLPVGWWLKHNDIKKIVQVLDKTCKELSK